MIGERPIRWMAVVLVVLGFCSSRGLRASVSSLTNRNKTEQSLAIVVNRTNPVKNISSDELRKLFLGRKSHWPNGRRVAVAMLDYRFPERHAALRQIYRMDERTYEEYFIKATFQGEVFVAPRTLASADLMRKFVFNAPGAIGYVRSSDLDDTVKVVKIDGRLPGEKNYSLQIDEPLEE